MRPKIFPEGSNAGYDPVWDDIYESGHEQKAPWDMVVSFVYQNKPKNVENRDINILEVGCGTASNLRFFAAERFNVSGIDASRKAIDVARKYFSDKNLKSDLQVCSFDSLPYDNDGFDLVIDRAALVHTGTSVQLKAIDEIYRVLKPEGRFFYTPYADTHTSCLSGTKYEDDLTNDISGGTLQGVGHLRFMSQEDIKGFFPPDKWNILSMEYETRQEMSKDDPTMHSNWRVTVEKK